MTLYAKWTPLSFPSLPRSSHTLSLSHLRLSAFQSHRSPTAILFSGEESPRVPVSNELVLVDLESHKYAAIEYDDYGTGTIANTDTDTESISPPILEHIVVLKIQPDDTTPAPRVGSASVTIGTDTYIYSGRAGPDMKPLDAKLHAFSADTGRWHVVDFAPDSPSPEPRSYHALTASGSTLYLHAGCSSAGGRFNDLWAFETTSTPRRWRKLADAPGPARGGTAIVAAGRADAEWWREGPKLYRIGGFDGKNEIGGVLDIYDIREDRWSSVTHSCGKDGDEGHENNGPQGPSARSVAGLVVVDIKEKQYLIYTFGEADPSSLGHAGAGRFLEDVWAFDIEAGDWGRVEWEGETPAARGWFCAVAWEHKKVVIQGGLGSSNVRLGDWWMLQFVTRPSTAPLPATPMWDSNW
ncbi:MAG: hypothetical protein M1827_002721 [Pycnora praestabilis]|nr:MAG: hypothetical protein M1827_002721 [Pycnora praestabilis]